MHCSVCLAWPSTLQASAEGKGKLARCNQRVHAQLPLRPCRQPLSVPPASRASHKPQPHSSVVAAAAAARGQQVRTGTARACAKAPVPQLGTKGWFPLERNFSHKEGVVPCIPAWKGASTTSHDSHASELSPEAAKEGMNWLAAWVSSQYMGMVGDSACMFGLRRTAAWRACITGQVFRQGLFEVQVHML
eukprot:1161821-Pelagomonas_calceolata.AAC.3